ncbi:hypothetical protein JT180_01085, partial [Helicobacter pylori]|nr:hypothetical protein [Helicobacter pylori]
NYFSFFVGSGEHVSNVQGNPPFETIIKNCSGLENCSMSKETYDKMKTLAENLQKAQGNLCALSEQCSSNQSSGNKTSI